MFESQDPKIAQQRKDDHLRLALELPTVARDFFEDVRLVYHSLPELDLEDISLATSWAFHDHSFPFYINAMTGGSGKATHYNRQLAILAREHDLAIASGSVSAALKDPRTVESFQVIRQEHPQGFVLANLGAHQPLEQAQRAVDLLEANALQIHLNGPQEIVMPEGDRHFSQWLTNIEKIVQHLPVPVIVKEVGFGMSQETLQQLASVGVETVDLAGRGGTNFIDIENQRRKHPNFANLLDFGLSTPESLLESLPYHNQLDILASGGIQNVQQVVKSLALGAKGVGVAGHFLKHLDREGYEATHAYLQDWKETLRLSFLMLGCRNLQDLQQHPLVITGQLQEWARARGTDYQALAQRP